MNPDEQQQTQTENTGEQGLDLEKQDNFGEQLGNQDNQQDHEESHEQGEESQDNSDSKSNFMGEAKEFGEKQIKDRFKF
jgi:hypothetical protein